MCNGFVGSSTPKILFLFGRPASWGGRIRGKNFTDRASSIVTKIVADLVGEEARTPTIGVFDKPMRTALTQRTYLYAIQCATETKPNSKISNQCAVAYTRHTILQLNPDVIVAMGNLAFRGLGITGGVKTLRGSTLSVVVGGKQFPVVPTVSPVALLKKEDAGLYSVLKNDIARAAKEVAGIAHTINLEELSELYEMPQTIEEVAAIAEEYATYTQEGKTLDNTLMALDTETNTKIPWSTGARIIMFSASVDTNKACAILLNHRESPYDWTEALPYVLKITMSAHPKTWWNYKFDLQMFICSLMPALRELCEDPGYRERLESIVGKTLEEILEVSGIANTKWDGLLGEHLLDEDKKGFYGLKVVVADYLPEFSGYEAALDREFEEASYAETAELLEGLAAPARRAPLGLEVFLEEDHLVTLDPSTAFAERSDLIEKDRDYYRGLWRGYTRKAYPDMDSKTFRARKASLSQSTKALTRLLKDEKALQKDFDRKVRKYGVEHQKHNSIKRSDGEGTATYEDLKVPVLSVYAAIDADVTKRISRQQRLRAYKEDPPGQAGFRPILLTLMTRHYLPLTELLSEMQAEGVYVDRTYLESLETEISAEVSRLALSIREKLFNDVGLPLNEDVKLNNPETLGNILIGMYGLPVVKRTDTGQASMSKDVLAEYIEKGYDIARDLLDWRQLGKANNTYIKAYLKLSSIDGCIHGYIHINGTATGRSSSATPNLQNVPYMLGSINIKKAFIPTPIHQLEWWATRKALAVAAKYGWVQGDELIWVDLDFAGAEVRVLCRYAQDPALLAALNGGQDMHSWMTAEIHGLDYKAVDTGRKVKGSEMADLRDATKRVVFGTIYGAGATTIGEQIGVDEREAQIIIDKLMTRFPLIRKYIQDTHREIAKKLRVSTPYGRFRRFPMARIGRWMQGRNERQGVNFLVQSYCSDIVMSCMLNIGKFRREICARLLLTVHDSMCLEMPRRLLPQLTAFLKLRIDDHITEAFPDMPVGMPYDVDVGPSYGEKMELGEYLKKHRADFLAQEEDLETRA